MILQKFLQRKTNAGKIDKIELGWTHCFYRMRSNIRDCSLVINNIRVMFMFSLPKKCSSHWLLRAVCGIGTRSKGHYCAPSYLARKFLPKLFINVKCIPNRQLTWQNMPDCDCPPILGAGDLAIITPRARTEAVSPRGGWCGLVAP